jgi:hypothetical protein
MPKKRSENHLAEKSPRNVMQTPTRGKNAGGQTNGQFENDPKHGRGRGQFGAAGDPPRIVK